MPLNIDVLQILLHMLNFVILTGGLSFLVYRPVCSFLEERRKHYQALEEENEKKAQDNEKMKAEYETKLKEARIAIEEMRTNAEKETAEATKAYLSEAKSKASAIIAAAEKEAEVRKEHILDSAQTEISELVVAATQKLLNDTVSPESDSAMYDEFIRLAGSAIADKRARNEK